jgi:hypothetical protein
VKEETEFRDTPLRPVIGRCLSSGSESSLGGYRNRKDDANWPANCLGIVVAVALRILMALARRQSSWDYSILDFFDDGKKFISVSNSVPAARTPSP